MEYGMEHGDRWRKSIGNVRANRRQRWKPILSTSFELYVDFDLKKETIRSEYSVIGGMLRFSQEYSSEV